MNANEFRVRGKEIIDYIADYLENINQRRVTPEVEPNFLKNLLPDTAPVKGEKWEDIFNDFETKIMPGLTHWQHPRFHAYFPAGNCYPSIIGELLSAGLGTVNFSWAASPSCTELETVVLDWLGKMLDLPQCFLPSMYNDFENLKLNEAECLEDDNIFFDAPNSGGGVILGSASECVLVSLLSARTRLLEKLKLKQPHIESGEHLSKLVMYCSKLAHSCVEKAAVIAMVKLRLLDTDENFSLRGSILEASVENDKSLGLIPFFVSTTFGTTSCCSFDNLDEIGQICNRLHIYLHVDGAYAGSALACKEFRPLAKGLEVKNKFMLTKALSIDPIYLRYKEMDKAIDYRHWGIALSRRFRALKIWFTLRSFGVEGIQKYIREHVRLAKKFEECVISDPRFEILGKVNMGLVCFRLKGLNSLSECLLTLLNDSGKVHMVPAILDEKYIIRFCVNAMNASDDDIIAAWNIIKVNADFVIHQDEAALTRRKNSSLYFSKRVSLKLKPIHSDNT